MKYLKIIRNGLIAQNPTFVLILGMCPTLGTTSSAFTGLSMGLATMAVLVCSNTAVSLLRGFVPEKVRIPAFILIISTFVTALQMAMEAWLPALNAALGIFIPLIVVNCILLGRAESFASRNGAVAAACDGLGTGAGFAIALTLIGAVRELAGSGRVFDAEIYPEQYGSLLFVLAPGAFIVLGFLMALFRQATTRKTSKK